jgi:hypothetical protein
MSMTDYIRYSRGMPLCHQSPYIAYLAVANEALKRAGGDPFCMRPVPRSTYRACWYNAILNREGTFRDAGMRLAIGCLKGNGVNIYGYTDPDDRRYRTKSSNCHVWLEDAYGRIYDYIHPGVTLVVQLARKTPTFPEGEVRGMTRAELAAQGLEYIEASWESTAAVTEWLQGDGSGWIPTDMLAGCRVRTAEMLDQEPLVVPPQLERDLLRIETKSEIIDESWRAGLRDDPLRACRDAVRLGFIILDC